MPAGRPKRKLANFARRVQVDISSSVMKLFSESVDTFTVRHRWPTGPRQRSWFDPWCRRCLQTVKGTVGGYMGSCIRGVLKAYAEQVRSLTLNLYGLQQLQVRVCGVCVSECVCVWVSVCVCVCVWVGG